MSRLRRPFFSDRFFFVTVKLLPALQNLKEADFARLARSLHSSRAKRGFLLTAWVFLPDHWHAIIFPRHPLTIS
jgi:REP element-mobilizing transposase RayT